MPILPLAAPPSCPPEPCKSALMTVLPARPSSYHERVPVAATALRKVVIISNAAHHAQACHSHPATRLMWETSKLISTIEVNLLVSIKTCYAPQQHMLRQRVGSRSNPAKFECVRRIDRVMSDIWVSQTIYPISSSTNIYIVIVYMFFT